MARPRYVPDNLPRPEHWDWRAACRGTPEAFFPEGSEARVRRLTAEAKAICSGCPVTSECLTVALRRKEPIGVWGGLDAEERRVLRAQERAAQEVPGDVHSSAA